MKKVRRMKSNQKGLRMKIQLKLEKLLGGMVLVWGLVTLSWVPKTQADGSLDCKIEFQNGKLCGAVEWISFPSLSDEARIVLRFWDPIQGSESSGPWVDPEGQLQVSLWMNMGGHGHGSRPTTIRRVQAGVFEVRHLYFVMLGTWDLRIQRVDPGTRPPRVIEQAVLAVEVL
jgi:hypothetical protein